MHELCVDALARLGDSDPLRTARVRAQLIATSDPFGPPEPLDLPPPSDDPEAAFLRLQAWYAARFAIEHVPERLAIADQAVELGRRTGHEEYAAWGRRWRMDAYAVLGDRIDLIAEVTALRPVVARLDRPDWTAYLLLVDAAQRVLEGRYDDALALADLAREADPEGEASFLHLVFASFVGWHTGRAVPELTESVRALLDRLPYLTGTWLAMLLKAGGHREEVRALWRGLAPHVRRFPERAPEWVIAAVDNAELCAWLGDADTARVLYAQLAPFSGLHAMGLACGPYGGPVDLALGRLAATYGEEARARTHLTAALRASEAIHAAPWQALVLAELGDLGDTASTARARLIATRLGMRPLMARLDGPAKDSPLSPREAGVAALVADGLSNAAIAGRLSLSERTVENHVSHILRKLDLTSRAGIAAWHARRTPPSS